MSRSCFYGFMILAVASLVFVLVALVRAPRDAARWTAVGRGGIWLIVAMVVLGVFAFVAFDAAFTLFHEIFFPGGNWAFPADSNLIRLYPEPFWELSAAALGGSGSLGRRRGLVRGTAPRGRAGGGMSTTRHGPGPAAAVRRGRAGPDARRARATADRGGRA